jgi:hypothetical protein
MVVLGFILVVAGYHTFGGAIMLVGTARYFFRKFR